MLGGDCWGVEMCDSVKWWKVLRIKQEVERGVLPFLGNTHRSDTWVDIKGARRTGAKVGHREMMEFVLCSLGEKDVKRETSNSQVWT